MSPMPSSPNVSVVIPCYRGERTLPQALGSALAQSARDLEVIVVDDASPDRCAEIADAYAARDARVRVIRRETNGGVSRAWNTGFQAARGMYFLRLAQDDALKPDAVEVMAAFLDAHPDVGLTYAPMDIVKEDGEVLVTYPVPADNPLYPTNKLGLCVMWRRSVWEAVGEFDPKCDFAEDYDYWLRVNRRFNLVRCTERPLLNFRHHEAQNSQSGERRQLRSARRALYKQRWMDVRERPWSVERWVRLVRCTTGRIVCRS